MWHIARVGRTGYQLNPFLHHHCSARSVLGRRTEQKSLGSRELILNAFLARCRLVSWFGLALAQTLVRTCVTRARRHNKFETETNGDRLAYRPLPHSRRFFFLIFFLQIVSKMYLLFLCLIRRVTFSWFPRCICFYSVLIRRGVMYNGQHKIKRLEI